VLAERENNIDELKKTLGVRFNQSNTRLIYLGKRSLRPSVERKN